MTQPPQGSKRTKFDVRREATHRELLRLGFERFPIKGYAATTIQDIVEDSGLTRGAFYFHFGAKEDLFLAVLRERAIIRSGWWDVSQDTTSTSLEEAIASSLPRMDPSDANNASWAVLIAEFAQSVRGQEKYASELAALYAEQVEEIHGVIEVFAARGWVRTDQPTAATAADVFAFLDGFGLHTQVYDAQALPGLVGSIARLIRP